MAITRFLAADQEQIEDSELIVASELGDTVQAILPEVDDGSGDTVDNNFLLVVVAQGDGGIEVLDKEGRRVWFVRPRTAVLLRSTDEPSGNPRWIVERPGQIEAVKITDLTATNLATAVAAAGLALSTSDTYAEATVEAAFDAAFDTVVADLETKADATLTEIEDKLNLLARALLMSGAQGLSATPNAAATVAAAATPMPAVADTLALTDKLYTSARAYDVLVRLPAISGEDGRVMRFEANSTGRIYVQDNYGRHVGTVLPGTNAYAQSSDNTNRPWQFFQQDSFEIPLGLTTNPGFVSFTRLSGQVSASALDVAAAYTSDAAQNTAIDTAVDAVFDNYDTKCNAAFQELEDFANSLVLTMEGADMMAES